MSEFRGYLLKATATGEYFPDKYMAYESWSSTPNQREELKAYRDDNSRQLHRITAEGKKSVFSFDTREGIDLNAKKEILKFFTDAESNAVERKINLEFWDEENNTYKTGDFYRPNMSFKIKRISNDNIWYKAMNFSFVEY